MALLNAHEGYEYEDLLSCHFILQELLTDSDSQFTIDKKENEEDRIDDITIIKGEKRYKKQVKYSNDIIDHQFQKSDLSTDSIDAIKSK